MDRLVNEIVTHVRMHVVGAVSKLTRPEGEIRTVFHGPPMEILRPVFEALTVDGGIDALLATGDPVRVPVLLRVDRFEDGIEPPPIGASGICDATYLIDLRNAPIACPRFLALVEPGHLASLSFSSASDDFGLTVHSNSGSATTTEWWGDRFVQHLVGLALSRHNWSSQRERDSAHALIEAAVTAADRIDKHVASRHSAWHVMSRVWSIAGARIPFGTQLSLACGFPPLGDGSVDTPTQERIMKELADEFLNTGFKPAIDELKQHATALEQQALNEFLAYIQNRCNAPHRFAHAPSYYYGPCEGTTLDDPPSWWSTLTLDVWRRLLDDTDDSSRDPAASLKLVCLETLGPKVKGIGAVVADNVQLYVANDNNLPAPDEVTITREMGGAGNRREWQLQIGEDHVLIDSSVPRHRSPIRYSVDGEGLKKTTIRVVSLASWEPGIIIFSSTATKVSLPKRVRRAAEGIALDLTIFLSGQGRHYIDAYVSPDVSLGDVAIGSGDDGTVDESRRTPIRRVGDAHVYGFEVEATGDCFYQFELTRNSGQVAELVRVYLTCDESEPEHCNSEFERLIRLNRPRGSARGSTDVNVNRQLRSADLQSWILAKDQATASFAPFVLGPDYASDWRAREWSEGTGEETIFSEGRFLHDPRPAFDEMQPPARFIELRAALFERIRSDDQNGLTEAAPLGEWLSTDPAFAQLVEEYLDTYMAWLDASPETAAWCDVGIVAALEPDGTTLVQDPDALLISPLHPVRLVWHCLAQRALFHAQRKLPCPAASILDPDAIPDALVLPLKTASGGIKHQVFFSVECSSDYWAILWNGSRLDRVPQASARAPFDKEFGVLVGGVSSGFSASQVARALDDVAEILSAKPLLSIAVSSAAGQNNACNEGLLAWCRDRYGYGDDNRPASLSMGPRFVHVIDERASRARPEDAEISNLAEDTGNAVRWVERKQDIAIQPDLTIIAQLETSNPGIDQVNYSSPLGFGGLIRHRVRQQLSGGQGAFLVESRMSSARGPTEDALADKTATAVARLENLSDGRYGYAFAPSVHAIRAALEKSDYAAVSSAAIDPACFLGGWLQDMYLWDYQLPSYSHRSGDSNGYYLLSKIKTLDTESLHGVLSKLPGCESMTSDQLGQIILEVARRGIPTVRGLSSGTSGASGDLGLFVASRIIQDEFRVAQTSGGKSLLPVLREVDATLQFALLIPIDPFRGYIDEIARSLGCSSLQRPDLLLVGVTIADSRIDCKLTAIEVKYRGREIMTGAAAQEALQQTKAFGELLTKLQEASREPDLIAWKLAFHHLLASVLGFGLRVYSQQRVAANQAEEWANIHARTIGAVLGDEIVVQIDQRGRLIILDGSPTSGTQDFDGDGFRETITISRQDASAIVRGDAAGVYQGIKSRVGEWSLMPDDNEHKIKAGARVESIAAPIGAGRPSSPLPSDTTINAVVTAAPSSSVTPLVAAAGSADAASSEGLNLRVGRTIDGFSSELRCLNLSDTNLNQLNIGVVGDLGTGKTQLLKSLVYQVVADPARNRGVKPRFLIFDYKKDYSSDDFVKAVGARVVKPQHLPINLFDVAGAGESMTPWLDRFKFFADVLDKIFSGVGPVQRQQLKTAVRQAYEHCNGMGRQPTIYDVHANYRALLGGKTDSPLAIIDDLVDMEMFSPEPGSAEAIDEFLNGVVVISLHALGQDDRTKNMLVAIMLNMFYEHMLRIPKRPFLGEDPQLRVVDSFLLVDEADNIMRYEFDVLRKILLQGREFGVGVILASQYLRHFKTGATDYREPLLSWFVHKVPNVIPQELSALGLAGSVAHLTERIKTLGKHECLFKTFDIPGEIVRGTPFYELLSH